MNGYSSESSSYTTSNANKEGIVQLTDIQLSSMNPPSTPSKQQQQQQPRRPSRHGPPPKAPPKTTRARRKNYLLNLNKICPGTLEELFTNATFLKRLFAYVSPLDRCTFSQVNVFTVCYKIFILNNISFTFKFKKKKKFFFVYSIISLTTNLIYLEKCQIFYQL